MIAFTAPLLAPSPSPSLSPSPKAVPKPSCATDSFCQYLYHVTDNKLLAESSYWVLIKPLRILMIVALALIARHIIHRAITRLIGRTTGLSSPQASQRWLRKRLPDALRAAADLPAAVLPSERRQQRAAALASVLRSIASAVVFVVTAMLVLAELGVSLAPILASAGIVGLAVGFGAQNLVKDFLAGMFIVLEDQFGVGDIVDLGQLTGVITGTIEAVGLRITTLRDDRGAIWYIRNGEIIRVGNKSQGWALAIVDVPVKLGYAVQAATVLRAAASSMAADPRWADLLEAPPEVLGIEEVTAETTVLRTTAKTTIEAQPRVGRELRRRITAALAEAGIVTQDPLNITVDDPDDPDAPETAAGESPKPGRENSANVQPAERGQPNKNAR